MKKQKNLWPFFIVLVVCFGIAAFFAWYIEVNFSPEKQEKVEAGETIFAAEIGTSDRLYLCAVSDATI